MPALAAALLDPVLDALKRGHLGQIEHLPRLRLHDRRLGQIAPAALAALHPMQHRPIGILATLQMMTLMPGLTARLATRPTPQTAAFVPPAAWRTHPRTAAWTSCASSDPAAPATPRPAPQARRSAEPAGRPAPPARHTRAGVQSRLQTARAQDSLRSPAILPEARRPGANPPSCPTGPVSTHW